jgi:hypothetical protein
VCIGWNFVRGGREDMRRLGVERAALLQEKRKAYDWLRRNSPVQARAIAGEDAALYLYTGRQAMRPIELLPSGAYDPAQLDLDLSHIADVAHAIGASYWMASPDDSNTHWVGAKQPLAARLSQIEAALPQLFRSSNRQVSIYGLACVQHPEKAGCQAADRVLFPGTGRNPNHVENGISEAPVRRSL